MTGVLIRAKPRRRVESRQKTPKERRWPCGVRRQRSEASICKPRNAKDRWQLPEAARSLERSKGWNLPQSLQKESTLPTT